MLIWLSLIAAAGDLPKVETAGGIERTLSNGIAVSIIGDAALKQSAMVHRVALGSAHEGPTDNGVAHLAEHLMFGATEEFPDGDWWDFIDGLGAYANAFTSQDDTRYVSRVPPEALDELIEREASRFAMREVAPAAVVRELTVVQDEIRLADRLEPIARLGSSFRSAALPEHPYGAPVGGSVEEVANLDAGAVEAWLARAHTGANLHVVVVGPHEPEAVFALIEQRYSSLPTGVRRAPVEQPTRMTKRVRVKERSAGRQRLVGTLWMLPPARPCASTDADAPCSERYWADQVALSLLRTEGRYALARRLSQSASMAVPIRVVTARYESGGFVAVMGERRSAASVALNNTGYVLGALTFGIMSGEVPGRWKVNPTPRRIESLVTGDRGAWITPKAVERARDVQIRRELSGAWDPVQRALRLVDRTAMGLDLSRSPIREIKALKSEEIRNSYGEIFRQEGVKVRVR